MGSINKRDKRVWGYSCKGHGPISCHVLKLLSWLLRFRHSPIRYRRQGSTKFVSLYIRTMKRNLDCDCSVINFFRQFYRGVCTHRPMTINIIYNGIKSDLRSIFLGLIILLQVFFKLRRPTFLHPFNWGGICLGRWRLIRKLVIQARRVPVAVQTSHEFWDWHAKVIYAIILLFSWHTSITKRFINAL